MSIEGAEIQAIQNSIYTIRGRQVMLDSDLAEIYGVETRVFNQAVKRNAQRFPPRFMFELTAEEWQNLKSQNVMSSGHGGRRSLPKAFTEQGVSMLSAVLKSETAIEVSIRVIDAFVEMRRYIGHQLGLDQRLTELEKQQLRFQTETHSRIDEVLRVLDSKGTQPNEGVFFEGQIFDAHTFVADLIRSATTSIRLVDNYIDDRVFALLTKRGPAVTATLYVGKLGTALQLDLEKHNAQYPPIAIERIPKIHDRFLIIDDSRLYHLGASIKDLGRQLFAFSRMDSQLDSVLSKITTQRG
jgi:hypothetical protein